MASSSEIYHEKQRLQLCAVHVLNNLMQEKDAFTKKEMDEICTNLSPDRLINPHRSVLGLGNYDVNVIMTALQLKNLSVIWFDKRKDVKNINLEKVKGFILNVPSSPGLGFIKLPFKFKHWIVIRKVSDAYYNLDSKLSAPEKIGESDESLIEYLTELLKSGERELLLVVRPEDSEECLRKSETENVQEESTEQSHT